jgi:tRNA 2-thiouridine synthesizing protein A
MTTMTATRVIDARGSFCPGPLMELIAAMKSSQVGDVIELLSNDKGSANDVPEWINKVGHEMVDTTQSGGTWHIQVRKKK